MNNEERITALGLLALAAGIATSALLGPLVLGVIEFRVSDNMENQLIGGEIVSLLIAAPVAALAGVLWWRGHRLGPVLAVGPALYAVYMYVQYIVGAEYHVYEGNNEYFFPYYVALIVIGGTVAVRAWTVMGTGLLPRIPDGLRRGLGWLLLAMAAAITLAWTASIAEVLAGETVQEYEEHPTLFWLVRLMDLGFIIPVAVVTGVGLLRRPRWAVRPGYAVAAFLPLLAGAVAGMAAVMLARDDPSASVVMLAVAVALTIGLAAVYLMLIRLVARPSAAPEVGRGEADAVPPATRRDGGPR